jgi:hypothetical protein
VRKAVNRCRLADTGEALAVRDIAL